MDTDGSERAGSLPVTLTPLVGRQRELRELSTLLGATRLLTLVGTGGSGKTRLGLALASSSGARFPDGVWWIGLASVTGRGLVAGTAAAALGIPQAPGHDTAVVVIRHLRARSALLVFDNCEQVIAECAGFVERLLRTCPGLAVVATSREMLGVPGERAFRVDGLSLPGNAGLVDRDGADGADAAAGRVVFAEGGGAVELFAERARAIAPEFRIRPGERAAVVRLCRQLDGLPLAIELAAARVGVLGVAEISRRLRGDVRVFRNPSRNAPARHQTLEATLDWSYRLLTQQEQTVFRRLSCFSGTFSLEAAEAVGAARDDAAAVGPDDVAGLVAALVGKSLVQVQVEPGGPGNGNRYHLLETIRQYAAGKLAGSGPEQAAVYAAHAGYFLRLAQDAQGGLEGAGQEHWLNRLELEHDNLRAVLRRALGVRNDLAGGQAATADARDAATGSDGPRDAAAGARLAALLWRFWYQRGYYHAARGWLERAAEAVSGTPIDASVLAGVLAGAGFLAFLQCDYGVAAERLTKARALHEEAGDQVGVAVALQRLGSIAREEGRYGDARRLHEESLAIWAALGDAAGVAASEDYLGFTAWLSGDAERAAGLCGSAVAAFRACGLRQEMAAALVNQGVATWLGGDPGRGAALLEESLDVATRLGYREGIAWALHELAAIIADDDRQTAAEMLIESLEIHVSLGDRWRVASVIETIATLAASADGAIGDRVVAGEAAVLMGGAAALRGQLGAPVPPAERAAHDRCARTLRDRLGTRGFRAAWMRGEPLELGDLIDAALRAAHVVRESAGPAEPAAAAEPAGVGAPDAGPHGAGPRGAGPARGYGLTDREIEVLRLLSEGLTNREIGKRLLISTGTTGAHVSNILRKLGVSSRVQAVSVAHRLGLSSPAGPGQVRDVPDR